MIKVFRELFATETHEELNRVFEWWKHCPNKPGFDDGQNGILEMTSGCPVTRFSLKHSHLKFCGFRHHIHIPLRLPHQFNIGNLNAMNRFDLSFNIFSNNRSHTTSRCS